MLAFRLGVLRSSEQVDGYKYRPFDPCQAIKVNEDTYVNACKACKEANRLCGARGVGELAEVKGEIKLHSRRADLVFACCLITEPTFDERA